MPKIESRQPVINGRRARRAAMVCGFLFYLLLKAGPLQALDPNKHVTQYIHTSWRIQDGLAPAADMLSIAQASDGFLWFVAARGFFRFDGVQFVPTILPADAPTTRIMNISADRSGGLWVVLRDEIVHLKGGIVSSHFELRGVQSTQNISEDPDGSLWVVRGAASSQDPPLCHVTHEALKCFGKDDGIPTSPINSLLSDGKGGFWLGGPTALVHWHAGRSEMYPSKGQIVSLVPDANGSLWVGMLGEGPGRGLAKWKDGTFKTFVTSTFDGSRVAVTRIISDRQGNLWVGTDSRGVFRIHGNVVEHYGRREGLSSDTVWTLFEDREGIVWAATSNGLDTFRDPAVTTFSALEGLPKDAAVGILAGKDGAIWVANNGSLDRIVNNTVSSIRTGAGLPGQQVTSLLEDHAGNMWVGVDDGLYLFEDGRFRRLPEPNHYPLGMVVGITEDMNGNIWAECAGTPRKLVRIRNFQVQEEFPESKIPPGHSITADPKEGIWIGTVEGDLAFFRNGTVEKKYPLNLSGESVADLILAQADGSVLAGSTDGLFGLRDGKPQRMTKKNGLPCNWVFSFVQDKDKRWWLYTECGIVELSDTGLQRWWANPEAVVRTRIYDALDGARPLPPSFNSAAYSSDGRVWFVTGAVVQMLDPSKLSRNALPAQTYIESVTVDRKESAAGANLTIPPRPRELQIDYTSPTFAIPQRVKFRYKLEGYDRDWHDAGTRRQAFYTDLRPGKYTFRVIACNSDGVWNDSAAKLDFSVTPAYYQTTWFRALCAALFLALLWAAYQLRARQLAAQFNMRLEERVSERTRIARDLHDTLLQSFQGLLPRFQAAIYKLPEHPADARDTLEAAVDQASQAITEGRDAVQGLRASTVEKNDLAMAIRGVAVELASAAVNQSPPRFEVAVQGTPRNLHPILRDEVYRIAAEALRNSFRHAQAHRIEVELRYDEKDFRLRIRDDGRGIGRDVLSGDGREGHYGLHGMRERAKLVGGELTIWSEVDSGTEVELSISAARAYAKSVRRFWFLEKKLSGKDKEAKEKIES